MGPQRNNLTVDEMLTVMSFIRSIYWGSSEQALWLTEEQRANFEPAEMPAEFREALEKFNESNGS
jgi:cytochrome c-L